MERAKLVARSEATGSEVSTARWSGVSQLLLRLMPASSWPAEMRNSWIGASVLVLEDEFDDWIRKLAYCYFKKAQLGRQVQ